MLAHFFKGDDSLEDRLPTGKHGLQIPEAMVALAATSVRTVQFNLLEYSSTTMLDSLKSRLQRSPKGSGSNSLKKSS